MGKLKKPDLEEPVSLLDDEDEETLAAIDQSVKAADEGRVVPLEKVRQRMKTWFTKLSSRKMR
jgi:predicted transcriptional regulator